MWKSLAWGKRYVFVALQNSAAWHTGCSSTDGYSFRGVISIGQNKTKIWNAETITGITQFLEVMV